jgi:4-amino-4-deoxy-L-arabinose transferase-like glycosyltransferase
LSASSKTVALVLLVAIGAEIRTFLWQVYEPRLAPDTSTYVELASQIAQLDFSGYVGRRTPMYSLLIVAAGMDHEAVWLIQSLLGIGISVLIFLLVLECVPSVRLAFAAGILHSLTLNQLFYEALILSETLTTFLVVASVWLFVRAVRTDGGARGFVAAGCCVAAAALTRPQYVYLVPLYVVILLMTGARPRRATAAFLVASIVPVLGWAAFNKAHVGSFGLSTQMGISLSQHAGNFIANAPDEFAAIRDTYLKHRARMPAGTNHMTVWVAIPEMLAVTQLSFIDLNRQLTKMSLTLFARHPDLYAKSVARAWIGFWPVSNVWSPEAIRGKALRDALQALWPAERVVLRGMNLALVLCSVLLGPGALWRMYRQRRLNVYVVLGSVVLAGSIMQALFEATDNARYSVPTQPLVAVFCIALAFQFTRRYLGAAENAEMPSSRSAHHF